MGRIRETELYDPVKRLLESQGHQVKGEVGVADIVARRGDEDPVIVELKTAFSLALFHQAITRQSITDNVYIAVPRASGRAFLKSLNQNRKLCRRLGLGLITVRLDNGYAEIHLDPAPYKPRQLKSKKTRLLKEFETLVGDPNTGGSTRMKMMTGYRQDALRCLATLQASGQAKASKVAEAAQVPRARAIMADNHYGWFERVERGIYTLSPMGGKAAIDHAEDIKALSV